MELFTRAVKISMCADRFDSGHKYFLMEWLDNIASDFNQKFEVETDIHWVRQQEWQI